MDKSKWDAVVSQYMKLSRAMQRSKFHEAELLSKCRDLKTELVEKAMQLQVAQAQRIEDEQTIVGLRNQMEKAVARADVSSVREVAARSLAADLQKEIENLKVRLHASQLNAQPGDAALPRSAPRGRLPSPLLHDAPPAAHPSPFEVSRITLYVFATASQQT